MPNYIPIFQHGGIGDQIVALPIIELFLGQKIPVRLYTLFPEIAKIFLPQIEIAPRHQMNFDDPEYSIHLIDTIEFRFKFTPDENALPDFVRPMYRSWLGQQSIWGELIRNHPGSGNKLGNVAVERGFRRPTLGFHLLGQGIRDFKFEVEPIEGQFITIHDGFDSTHKFDTSMKSWPVPYWEDFVRIFKVKYPNVKVYQLGGAKHHPIAGTDENLAGKLPFAESLRYLKSSLVHVDGDSGLVHARHLFKKASVVIFGPTNHHYFGYPENINLEPWFCGNCWWKKSTWMKDCVEGHPRALCMESVEPNRVINSVSDMIEDMQNV